MSELYMRISLHWKAGVSDPEAAKYDRKRTPKKKRNRVETDGAVEECNT